MTTDRADQFAMRTYRISLKRAVLKRRTPLEAVTDIDAIAEIADEALAGARGGMAKLVNWAESKTGLDLDGVDQ